MDAFDEILFTYALADVFSYVDIWGERSSDDVSPVPRTFSHGGREMKFRVPIYEAGVDRPEPADPDAPPADDMFTYKRSSWSWGDRVTSRWPFDRPYLAMGELSVKFRADNAAMAATSRQLFRILNRVTTNRVNFFYPAWEKQEFSGSVRFGHHALDWCAGTSTRIVGNRCRPADDWSAPTSKWYRSLWDRVVADYGEDFADPHLRGPLVQFTGPVPWDEE